ncbi:MAG TPA: hypothetical protein VJU13_01380 [Candidatus Nitrosocosmicus sp.]|nr:hypothetical protein [Candidatus Nitrosocosmicus sp.]
MIKIQTHCLRETKDQAIFIFEAVDNLTIKKLKEITFVDSKEIFGIIRSSKTGNTILKCRQLKSKNGKVISKASPSALVNLVESVESGVLTKIGFECY